MRRFPARRCLPAMWRLLFIFPYKISLFARRRGAVPLGPADNETRL